MALYSILMDSVSITNAQDLIRVSSLSSSYTAATGTLSGSGTVGNTNTVTIGNKTYTFQTTLTNVDGNVLIGANLAASMQNLFDAINLTGTPGTQYAAAMTKHTQVIATAVTTTSVTVKAKAMGDVGNAIAVSETVATLSWNATTLLGGAGSKSELKLSPPAAPGFYIRSVTVRSDDSETANQISLGLYVGATDPGVGTAYIPRPMAAAPAFTGVATVNLTTAATKSPAAPLTTFSGDVASEGANWYSDRDEAVFVPADTTFVLRLENNLAGATTLTAEVLVEQF